MQTRTAFVYVTCGLLLALASLLPAAICAPKPPASDKRLIITVSGEDLSPSLRVGVRFPKHGAEEKLVPLPPQVALSGSVGGGIATAATESANGTWSVSVQYSVYDTSDRARKNALMLEDNRALAHEPGSFSGAKIGDECGHRATADTRELHFVRHNVSVKLWSLFPGRDADEKKRVRASTEKMMEVLAAALVKRIDRVVAAKGKVEMSNLPPLAPRGEAVQFK